MPFYNSQIRLARKYPFIQKPKTYFYSHTAKASKHNKIYKSIALIDNNNNVNRNGGTKPTLIWTQHVFISIQPLKRCNKYSAHTSAIETYTT